MADTKRVRGGVTASVAASGNATVPIPAYATQAQIVATVSGLRDLVSGNATAPALTADNYGVLVASIPHDLTFTVGRDTHIHFQNPTAGAITYNVTFFN